jgi:hypothetical protein
MRSLIGIICELRQQRRDINVSALAHRQRGATVTIVQSMKELLQQKDPDYYRSVELLIAHAEFQQLPQWCVDVMRRSKIPLGMCRSPKNFIATLSLQGMKPQHTKVLPSGYSPRQARGSARCAYT